MPLAGDTQVTSTPHSSEIVPPLRTWSPKRPDCTACSISPPTPTWPGSRAPFPGGAGDVVLSPQLEEDYELMVDRFLAICHVGDRLAAYLYRGLRSPPSSPAD